MGEATVVQAYRFALDPTPGQQRRMASHAGASRFVFNRMLAEVKATLTTRQWETRLLGAPLTEAQGWSLAALRRTWNANKDTWAPWCREVSKEAFNHGLEALSRGLKNWADGKEAARKVGFPRFKKRGGRTAFAYTTGSIRLLDDRRSVQLPRLGRIRSHENTRKLHHGSRTAQIVEADRWFASSKTCSGCGGRKPSLSLSERTYRCEVCDLTIDRDLNAAVNLARYGVPSPGSGPADANFGRRADHEPDPAQAGDVGGCETSTHHGHPSDQSGTATPQEVAA